MGGWQQPPATSSAAVAQWQEHLIVDQEDVGSSPIRSAKFTGSSSAWSEFSVWNRDAASSNLAFPTKHCFVWKPRPVLTKLDREERYLDEVPIIAALAQLAGGDWLRTSTVSVRIRGAVPIKGDAQG